MSDGDQSCTDEGCGSMAARTTQSTKGEVAFALPTLTCSPCQMMPDKTKRTEAKVAEARATANTAAWVGDELTKIRNETPEGELRERVSKAVEQYAKKAKASAIVATELEKERAKAANDLKPKRVR